MRLAALDVAMAAIVATLTAAQAVALALPLAAALVGMRCTLLVSGVTLQALLHRH